MLNLHIHKAFVHFQVPSTLKLVEYSFINLWLPFCYRLHESLFCQLPPECYPYHLNVQHTVMIVGQHPKESINITSSEDSGVGRPRILSQTLLPPEGFEVSK